MGTSELFERPNWLAMGAGSEGICRAKLQSHKVCKKKKPNMYKIEREKYRTQWIFARNEISQEKDDPHRTCVRANVSLCCIPSGGANAKPSEASYFRLSLRVAAKSSQNSPPEIRLDRAPRIYDNYRE